MSKLRILLVEDDLDDVELLQDALRENQVNFEMHVIMEGDKVMPYLRDASARPHIIVMDFNLPKIHGRELLVMLRGVESLATIPVVVLTTSASPHDIKFANDNGAASFITKPSTFNGFNSAVQTIVSIAAQRGFNGSGKTS